jgi:hypothetical protein
MAKTRTHTLNSGYLSAGRAKILIAKGKVSAWLHTFKAYLLILTTATGQGANPAARSAPPYLFTSSPRFFSSPSILGSAPRNRTYWVIMSSVPKGSRIFLRKESAVARSKIPCSLKAS